ncbi:hypothetical protein Lepto7376_0673 [[Leptolyngbya] sp. PCC 7376]|uniref:DUF3084 domain-containing protein n=1 Tax=[Leptolyngbya] sp. PCC 7376 TaxID=111781 RepID=UPI00029F2B3E|nr:DUF3084 domain-containing protein [[Leptolyngbya] sp. PCC 7376]AFY37077.1 hypothetical protein Lepto7376_0673 [[Leptolyngbya] sp. PCC 7376]
MTSAFVLIFSVLILGGILAALGDRLGSKVGKARLSLFNLRPKQTAVVVTVMTGTVIAASTLGLLFGLSKSLRQGVFQLDGILAKRRKELQEVNDAKTKVEEELELARQDQLTAQNKLEGIETKFENAQSQLTAFRDQASVLEKEITDLASEQRDLKTQRDQLAIQSEKLATQSERLQTKVSEQNDIIEQRSGQIESLETQRQDLQTEIDNRDQTIANLDQAIADKDQVLQDVESQIFRLQEQIDILEASYINFRSGNVALTTGQVLAFGVVRIIDINAVNQAVDELLREANRNAIVATRGRNPDFDERVVQITNAQVQNLVSDINDGRDYVVRLLSAGNYLQGESQVQVFADAVLRQRVFIAGDVIATLSLENLSVQNPTAARQPIDFLLGAAQFQARQAGILGDIQVRDGDLSHIIKFADAINQSLEPVTEIQAIAMQNADNAGPLMLELVALSDGKVVFRR